MTTKTIYVIMLSVIATLAISTLIFQTNAVYAEENEGYKMAEDVRITLTFTFRDGVEIHEFPVFEMTSDYIENKGTSFKVKGVVDENSPHLHRALDDAYKFRLMTSTGASSFEHDYRFFDIDVDFQRDGDSIRSLHYYNCEVLDYEVETLDSKDYESYMSSKSGFAIVDTIEFRCGGLNPDIPNNSKNTWTIGSTLSVQSIDDSMTQWNYGSFGATSPYDFAENVRTNITFEFDGGVEKIEFPAFEMISGFAESDDNVDPHFQVEGVISSHPLLFNAIDNARAVSGIDTASNTDFEALVEFSNGEKVLRSLDFRDCRVSAAIITTQYDKEEGFTGKRGFAIVERTDITCAGLKPLNSGYEELSLDSPIWKTSFMTNEQTQNGYNMADGPHAIATFTFNNGRETINFPIFNQQNILNRNYPTFTLEGIVGDYPLLYERVDENLKLQSVSGANLMIELFDIDVNLMYGEDTTRGFNYSNCRVIDYDIGSDMNKEESYFKGFALENTFDFECQGYHANNPVYDTMFETYDKAKTVSTNDLRNTDQWGPGFYVQ